MRELVNNVVEWGQDRGLDKVGHEAQARYTLKETAELLDAYADKDIDAINDAIGDILVTLLVGASNDDDILESVAEWIQDDKLEISGVDPSGIFGVEYALLSNKCFNLLHSKPSDLSYIKCVMQLDYIAEIINHEFNQSLSLQDCLELAYNEIKNRTGKLVNGQFIKDN